MRLNKEKKHVQICMNEDANNKEKSFKQKFAKIGKEIKELECKLVKMSSNTETKSIEV